MSNTQNNIIQKIFSSYLFRVMAAWFGVYIHDKVAEAMSHIPNGLTVMSEKDWAKTTPADLHIYMVFPDEQVTESES